MKTYQRLETCHVSNRRRCCFYCCHCHFDMLGELGDGWCVVVMVVVVVVEVIKVIFVAKTKNKHSIKNFRKKTSRGGLPLITVSRCCCWCGRCCGRCVVVVVVVVVVERWAGSSKRLRNQHKSRDLLRVGLNDFQFFFNMKSFKPTLNKSCDLCWFRSLLGTASSALNHNHHNHHNDTATTSTTATTHNY